MATAFVSMATRLSDLDNQKPGTNIQKEGHTLTLPSGQNSPENPEAFGSVPSQSPARKPDCHEPWYCLEIQVISTKDESSTTSISCMAGANCGRHGVRWQSWPNRSHSDRPRLGHPVVWVTVIRRTEFGQGMRHHVYAVRHHQLGWQMSPTEHQASKPG